MAPDTQTGCLKSVQSSHLLSVLWSHKKSTCNQLFFSSGWCLRSILESLQQNFTFQHQLLQSLRLQLLSSSLFLTFHCQLSCFFLIFESLLSFSWEFFRLFLFFGADRQLYGQMHLTLSFTKHMCTDVMSMLALVKYTEQGDRWLGFLSSPRRLFWL